jgi:thioredoxin-like negative regulator of GroEL
MAQPAFIEAAKILKANKDVKIGAMNGQKFPKFAEAYGVKGFPHVIGFVQGEEPEGMAGLGDANSIVQFALKKLGKGGPPDPNEGRSSRTAPRLLPGEVAGFFAGKHKTAQQAKVSLLLLSDAEAPSAPDWLTLTAAKFRNKDASKKVAVAFVAQVRGHCGATRKTALQTVQQHTKTAAVRVSNTLTLAAVRVSVPRRPPPERSRPPRPWRLRSASPRPTCLPSSWPPPREKPSAARSRATAASSPWPAPAPRGAA